MASYEPSAHSGAGPSGSGPSSSSSTSTVPSPSSPSPSYLPVSATPLSLDIPVPVVDVASLRHASPISPVPGRSEPLRDHSSQEERRPQAGPLPTKRGEIGYREDMHGVAAAVPAVPEAAVVMPERHPADRDHSASQADSSVSNPATTATATTPTSSSTPNASTTTAPATDDDASSTASLGKHKRFRFLALLGFKKMPIVWGIRLPTFLLFIVQTLFICLTITAWAISIRVLTNGSLTGPAPSNSNSDNNNDNNSNSPPGASSAIFVHVIFAILLLCQLLFYERRIYRIRAERYAFLHPGEMLPSSFTRGQHARDRILTDPFIALSPWNRPPLPTYAAALAQSGAGTGDVEDHMIAVVPPPAYGNTRGSTFLLSGFLRESLRAQRPVSVHSQASQAQSQSGMSRSEDGDLERGEGVGAGIDGERSRPVSYQTIDEEWEVIQDMGRAMILEETLTTLEGGTQNHQPSTSRR